MNYEGIYEQLVTEVVKNGLNRDRFYIGERQMETGEAAIWLSRFLTKVLAYAVDSIPAGAQRLTQQIELANALTLWLKNHVNDDDFFSENLLDNQGRILTAMFSKENPVALDLARYSADIFPLTGLTQSELFCGSNAGLSLESELKREIASADEIYWLVSFIKWAGIRIFKAELEHFARMGKKLKVITTSYMGATDAKAVEFLASLPNVEVKLSYNTQRERLHAKSYLFMRKTGFNTGYIGSSNLSHSALTTGLEWNLKITSKEIPHIIDKSISTFETYWRSSDFELFDGDSASKLRLVQALSEARGGYVPESAFHFDIKPFPHQVEILDVLESERSLHNRYRNLVVAATGTGKTIISAFDFARYYKKNPAAKFLFVAHRQEILTQALAAYRGVLKNSRFGELWVGGEIPKSYDCLFASIQTMNINLATLPLGAEYFDYIVVDEVHHISAKSYRPLLMAFSPKILLGLTATPERQDGQNILDDFCGVIAAEIRLPEAINRRHLCPFQYFAVDDGTDLSRISWSNGRYDSEELTQLYAQNGERVSRIVQSLSEIITDVGCMKALAFCVSKKHAQYMVDRFRAYDISCDFLTSDNSSERVAKRQMLIGGQIQILCVVDIFNEGVDIPELDTLLFLRPTESLTVFLQQLGRGLRLADDKQCCTVLDFVGNSRSEYDFSHKFRALIGKTNQSIEAEIQNGFPHLPLGCSINLEEKAQATILANIRRAAINRPRLLALIRGFSSHSNLGLTLQNFLRINSHVCIEDIYKIKIDRHGGWATLVETALSEGPIVIADERIRFAYYRAIDKSFFACTSISYLRFVRNLVLNDFHFDDQNPLENRFATMCYYDFWGEAGQDLNFSTMGLAFEALRNVRLQQELVEVLEVLINRVHDIEGTGELGAHDVIRVHARYTRQQILTGYGVSTFDRQSFSREGVILLKEKNVELLFVTLNKSEKRFSPTTMYHDYAVSDTRFHWQSQNSSRPDKGKGLSYVRQEVDGLRVILFVREQENDENGRTMGFVNFGCVKYISHQGSRPMNITWELNAPMPAAMWHDAAKLAVG